MTQAAQNDNDLSVNFSSFLVSLATSAMVHLGEGPPDAPATVDLELARNTIDLLGVLQKKTEGNLDDDEKKLLDTLLFETRSKYMTKAKA